MVHQIKWCPYLTPPHVIDQPGYLFFFPSITLLNLFKHGILGKPIFPLILNWSAVDWMGVALFSNVQKPCFAKWEIINKNDSTSRVNPWLFPHSSPSFLHIFVKNWFMFISLEDTFSSHQQLSTFISLMFFPIIALWLQIRTQELNCLGTNPDSTI